MSEIAHEIGTFASLLELLEKARTKEHDRVPWFKGRDVISLSDYEAALRAQRDEWLKNDGSIHTYVLGFASDIDPDGKP